MEASQGFYARVRWIMLALALTGGVAITAFKGIRYGGAFVIGAGLSFLSFWGWERVVDSLGPKPDGSHEKRSNSFFVLRLIALGGLACVIIKYLRLDVAAATIGLLVSGAAVILEVIYELIYAS